MKRATIILLLGVLALPVGATDLKSVITVKHVTLEEARNVYLDRALAKGLTLVNESPSTMTFDVDAGTVPYTQRMVVTFVPVGDGVRMYAAYFRVNDPGTDHAVVVPATPADLSPPSQ